MIPEVFRDKLIIVAKPCNAAAQRLITLLHSWGLHRCLLIDKGDEVFPVLRRYYSQPEQLGLLLIRDDLDCALETLCETLTRGEEGIVIPVIVLRQHANVCALPERWRHDLDYLCYETQAAYNEGELLILVELFLRLQHERQRYWQEQEKWVAELADRKLVDARLQYLIAHDELTGLINRNKLEQHLKVALQRHGTFVRDISLLFIDLDHFGLINELEGFDVGDCFLVESVQLMRPLLPRDAVLARVGSDEFAIVLPHVAADTVRAFADTLRSAFETHQFHTADHVYAISISIGIASSRTRRPVTHPKDLITRARQACQTAKQNGRNIVWEYNDQDKFILERHRDVYWLPLIREALLNDYFYLEFQPIVDLKHGRVSHYEVLVRIKHPQAEQTSSAEFIAVAERMGLIHAIDLWVVQRAIDFLTALPPRYAEVSLAINLSAYAFQNPSLLPVLQDKLAMSWINPARLTFEITETAAIDNFAQTQDMILKIRALGCRFALDDFGAGFCSFNYLKKFPVDYVKIDGQFILNLVHDATDRILVKSMNDIAKQLGKKTIAEYVESPQTVTILQRLGIDMAQGYLFGKPRGELLADERLLIADYAAPVETLDIMNSLGTPWR